ncbi:hypothetical protein [Oceanibaculum indicum]|uniref:Methyl-accepting chemotaxis protein n=1 Tax=Oceanibaculum indicum TaxID=526216 RepID=A0A420WPZ4_9PROT|nr:hypothetical protein [Oceanibaculum indicum]RKQ73108.1 hypothetical protein BCL74_0881 [Oceanibaculum indicum]
MGGKSSSSSSSSTTNVNTDARIAATDQAVVIGEGGSYSVVATDYGSVEAAIRTVEGSNATTQAALQASVDAANIAAAASSAALASNERATGRALDTVDKTVDESFDFVRAANEDALGLVDSVQRQAFDVAKVAQTSIADFADQALGRVDESMRDEAARSIDKLLSTASVVAIAAAAAYTLTRMR